MPYVNFLNGTTELNDSVLNGMQRDLMQLVFPIGSTYITQDNTNPATILEFGTWERLKGKVCLGLDEDDEKLNEIGKTGGEKEHTLTIEEMPSHSHSIKKQVDNNSGSQIVVGSGSSSLFYQNGNEATTNNAGGGQAHNNMPPYETVGYMWIRRA